MVILDTHIWVWYVNKEYQKLTQKQLEAIEENIDSYLYVSVISCWEVAKKYQDCKMELKGPIEDWMSLALSRKGIHLLDLSVQIVIESTKLPGSFHSDPMDRFIVASSRCLNCALVTSDQKIIDYPYVQTIR